MEFCKACGGAIARIGNFNVCEVCSNRWTTENVGSINTDENKRAWEVLRNCDFEKATELFEQLIFRDGVDYEAYWGKALADNSIEYVTDLGENKKTPTCNNLSENSFLENKDVQKAISKAPKEIAEEYKKQAEYIEKIRLEWVEKASKEPAYDIFISYKDSDRPNGIERTQDSIDAQDLYNALVDEGYKVFFSRISLRNKVSEQYEPYIYNAINTAKVMIVFGEKAEYFTSPWIKNEWTRYIKRIEKNQKKKESLIVLYKNMNPGDLPVSLANRQSINFASFGASSLLFKHIKKVIGEAEVQQQAQPALSPEYLALLKKLAEKEENERLAKEKAEREKIERERLAREKAEKERLEREERARLAREKAEKERIERERLAREKAERERLEREERERLAREKAEKERIERERLAKERAEREKLEREEREKLARELDQLKAQFDYRLEEVNKRITLVKYIGKTEQVVIPEVAGGYTVRAIEKQCFYYGGNLNNRNSLREINLPNTITSIGDEAFSDCNKLEKINLPCGLENLGCWAFLRCEKLLSITIPDSVKTINKCAFSGCKSLVKLTLPQSLEKIDEMAFCDCKSLVNVDIPDGIKSVARNAFAGCNSLTGLNLPQRIVAQWKEQDAIDNFKTKFEYQVRGNTEIWLKSYKGRDKEVFIPDYIDGLPVTCVSNSCFYAGLNGSSSLESITLPKTLQRIGPRAFYHTRLKSIIIPDGTTSIGEEAFLQCENLANITIPDSVTSIGKGAFHRCDNSNLLRITLPSGIKVIEEQTFCMCKSLREIKIPNSVTNIGNYAFYGCEKLTSVNIPNSVVSIGEGAFKGCKSLKEINIPVSVKLEKDAFMDCKDLQHVKFVGDVDEEIINNCFSGCPKLILPESILKKRREKAEKEERERIAREKEERAKAEKEERLAREHERLEKLLKEKKERKLAKVCVDEGYSKYFNYIIDKKKKQVEIVKYKSKEEDVTIPDKIEDCLVTIIGANCFKDTNIKNIIIPGTIKKICADAFRDCRSIIKVNYLGTIDQWAQIEFENEYSTPLCYERSLHINGEWIFKAVLTKATKISNYAFSGCKDLKTVVLPSSVTNIGRDAFCRCRKLTSISIPNTVKSIEPCTFFGCKSLIDIRIPYSVNFIGSYTFGFCESLQNIVIPDSVTNIGLCAFV